jgi:probable addiction module antidote protein
MTDSNQGLNLEILSDGKNVCETLSVALENRNLDVFLSSLGELAKSYGMSNLARDTGLNRESLYKVFTSDGNPQFATILKVSYALGLQFSINSQYKDKEEELVENSYWRNIIYGIAELQQKRNIKAKLKILETDSNLIFEKRKTIAFNLLVDLIDYSIKNVPYYKDNDDYKNFKTEKLLEDPKYFETLPILTDDVVIKNKEKFLSLEYNNDESNFHQRHENKIYLDSESRDWIAAQNILTLQWAGKSQKWREARLSSVENAPKTVLDYLAETCKGFILKRNYIYIQDETAESQAILLKKLKSLKPGIVHSPLFLIYNFAQYVDKNSFNAANIFSVIVINQSPIAEDQKEFIQNVFQAKVVTRYGSDKFGVIAQELAEGPLGKLKVSDLMVWPEVISLDEQTKNSLVFTNLRNKAMPLIRYKTAETGELEENSDGWWLTNLNIS